MARNIADEGQVKEATAKERRQREQELNDLRAVLETDSGRRFIWRYLGHAQVFQECFTGQDADTNFALGRRNIGLRLLADIDDAKPEALLQMLQESKQREDNDA